MQMSRRLGLTLFNAPTGMTDLKNKGTGRIGATKSNMVKFMKYLNSKGIEPKVEIVNEEVELDERINTGKSVFKVKIQQGNSKMFKTSEFKTSGEARRFLMKMKKTGQKGFIVTPDGQRMREEVELDEMKEPFVVVDTADGNKVVGTASDEKGAKSIITSAELPPMKIKDKKTLKIMKSKKRQMIGQPFKEEYDHIKEMIQSGKFTRPEIKKMIERNILEQSSDFFKKARMKAGLPPTPTARSAAGYELFHKTFSGAMQHAYAMAKKNMGMTVDKKEIDDKVATGPKKPGVGKTNRYSLKTNKGMLQIQVYNRGGSKPFELNMYSS